MLALEGQYVRSKSEERSERRVLFAPDQPGGKLNGRRTFGSSGAGRFIAAVLQTFGPAGAGAAGIQVRPSKSGCHF